MGSRGSVIWVMSTVPEAGKTRVAAGLLDALLRAGRTPVGMKPIELAATYGEDHDLVSVDANLLGSKGAVPVPPLVRAPYRFATRTSPALAASMMGLELDLADLAATIDSASAYGQPVVVDSPGAAFSPLFPGCLGLDLAQHVGGVIVLVVPEIPGGDALAFGVLEGCRARGLAVAGLITTGARWTSAELAHFASLAGAPLFLRQPEPQPEPWDAAIRQVLDALPG